MAIAEIRGLEVSFEKDGVLLPAVQGADFLIDSGECLALVGESGCGKSVSAFSFLGLCPGHVFFASYYFDGDAVDFEDAEKVRALRGCDIGMVFQDALAALDPVLTVGSQMREALRERGHRKEDDSKICAMLERVGIADPKSGMRSYPHQLSGGMRQRVMIAIALLNSPGLLIADEPTTALDVTIQAQILELFKAMRSGSGMSLLFITHDLGIVEDIADRIAVMYAGRIVEQGPVQVVLNNPAHPYTKGLLDSVPDIRDSFSRFQTIPGRVPSLSDIAGRQGCLFRPRCERAAEPCKFAPPLSEHSEGRLCACYFPIGGGQGA